MYCRKSYFRLLCEVGNDSCVRVALFIAWKMLMLYYEREREEDSRYQKKTNMTLIVNAETTVS